MAMRVELPDDLRASDLDSLPEDNSRRWELIDGVPHVSPPPPTLHQIVAMNLYRPLRAARTEGLLVLGLPIDYRPNELTNLEPDFLVTDASELDRPHATITPLLVGEILSLNTRLYDLGTKRLTYEALGVPAYWIIDPDEPRVTVLELVDGHYEEAANAGPGEVLRVERPFPASIEINRLHDV